MIDCHCHMLPGVDDGSKSIEQSLQMARKAVECGITDVVVTPHNLNGVFLNSRQEILKSVASLRLQLAQEDISLRIYPGSEIHLVPELLESLASGESMTYADLGKAILLELPKHFIPNGTQMILENLVYSGVTPVIAHPERNSDLRRHSEKIQEWIEIGCKMQLTAQSCAGDFGPELQVLCRQWCERGWVHLIASDAHRVEGRAPDMRAGARMIAKWMGGDTKRIMTMENPRALITGEELVACQALASTRRKKRLFGF